MQWIKKHLGSGDDNKAPFIVGSDKWMGSTAQHKGDQAASTYEAPQQTEPVRGEMFRSQSMAPSPTGSSRSMGRTFSLGSVMRNEDKNPYVSYPDIQPYTSESGKKQSTNPEQASAYPKVYEGKSDAELAEEDTETLDMDALSVEGDENDSPFQAREECLVTIPGAIVHLVDEEMSPHLATGHLSIVRIMQRGNGIIVLVRVGEHLHWPLMKDEPAVKLDPTHYFFTLRVPPAVDEANGNGNLESQSGKNGSETLSYGVTFPQSGHEEALHQLDTLLDRYSSFSAPKILHGDEQKEDFMEMEKMAQEKGSAVSSAEKSDNFGGMVVPPEMVSSDGKKVVITETNQGEFWTTMAPNVDDYGSSAARFIATGAGQIIRGIFWVRDSTVAQLESGTIYMKSKIAPTDKPNNISPRTLRNLRRVRNMSRATENVAKSVLSGVVMTAGFFSGAIIKSSAGKRIFKLMPGEVALISLDAFAKLFDAVEKATQDVLQSSSLMTQNVVSHRFGESAGQVTQETLATAGHVVATAWTVTKLRNALNPKGGIKPTKTSMVKGVAKNILKGGSK